ncbi:MAG TPA: penicillin acylase family protein [Rhizomicrobium sp.]|jgi:acyl-homoserine-lactone acylase|nr:penicillin acylase family protein [Rhizomicrobium sp.]
MPGHWKSVLLGAAAVAMLGLPAGSAPAAPNANNGGPHGEILWDTFGVPHVFGKDEAGVFYGFGWAQVKSHANLVLRLYGQAQGRAAEYWGEDYAESDRWVITNGVHERAQRWYAQQTPQFRKDLDAFAAGMTASAHANAATIDPAVLRALPITGVDVIAHAHRLFNYIYVTSLEQVQNVKDEHDVGGSNAWAVAPAKSKSGNTMLLANPHLPWAPSFFTYYEAGLEGPGIHMYGATQIGLPMLRFDFDDRHGFTNTVNTILGASIYKLTPAPGGFEAGYMFDGQAKKFDTRQASFKIRQVDGSMKTEHLTIRSTVQGPVFVTKAGAMVALKVAGLERPEALKEYWDLGMAKTYDQALTAFRKVQVPTFNIVYADREGNILYVDNGIEPKRKKGDFAYWKGLVPGDTSDTLWSDNDVMSFDEIPHVANPPSHFVQNTNDPPYTSTWPQAIHYKEYPPYVSVEGPLSMRNEQSLHLMADSGKVSYEDFIKLKHTTRALLADRMIPDLIEAVGTSSDPDIQKAVAVLKGWDHQYNADSKGALLFEEWVKAFAGPNMSDQKNYAEKWDADKPIETPRGIKDPAAALTTLKAAVANTVKLYGAVDRPYGEVSRFHIGDVNLPGNGGFGNLGIFRTITWDKLENGQRKVNAGETWVSLVEFSKPIKAMGVMSYGDSSQPGSKHNSDQLKYVASRTLRTLWVKRPDVEKHVEEKTEY